MIKRLVRQQPLGHLQVDVRVAALGRAGGAQDIDGEIVREFDRTPSGRHFGHFHPTLTHGLDEVRGVVHDAAGTNIGQDAEVV